MICVERETSWQGSLPMGRRRGRTFLLAVSPQWLWSLGCITTLFLGPCRQGKPLSLESEGESGMEWVSSVSRPPTKKVPRTSLPQLKHKLGLWDCRIIPPSTTSVVGNGLEQQQPLQREENRNDWVSRTAIHPRVGNQTEGSQADSMTFRPE